MARAKRETTSRRKKKGGAIRVNFKDVESRQTPPEGDYLLKVLEAVSDTGPSGEMIVFTLEIAKGKYKGQKVWFYCPLAENSLWKLHGFLTALGLEVPSDEMDIDLDEVIDLEVVGVLTHETYNGRKRAKMTDFESTENYKGGDEDDDDDEDDKKSKSKKKSKKASDDDDDEDDEDEKPKRKGKKKPADDDDDDDEEDEKSKRRSKSKSKKDDDDEDEDEDDDKKSKKVAAKGKKAKDEDDEDEDDEDDEPKSKSKKKPAAKSKKKPKKLDRDEVEEMDEDELQELIDEHDLDVDLDDYKKLPKKVAAVIEALEEEDLIEEDDD